MTRSDILLAKIQADTPEKKDALIEALEHKIENVYSIVFTLEKFKDRNEMLDKITKGLRKALESEQPQG